MRRDDIYKIYFQSFQASNDLKVYTKENDDYSYYSSNKNLGNQDYNNNKDFGNQDYLNEYKESAEVSPQDIGIGKF